MSTKNATGDHEGIPERIVPLVELFGSTDKPLQRIMAEDLANVPHPELVAGFREAYGALEGFKQVAAEALSVATYTVLNDAQARAAEALERLEA